MNNTQLETFLKIVETGSFTATANMLGYAQSTVTTQIRDPFWYNQDWCVGVAVL